MTYKLYVCGHPDCSWVDYQRTVTDKVRQHTSDTGHEDFKLVKAPPALLRHQDMVRHERHDWEIEETTLDSAVMNNFVSGTQHIALRVVLVRKPKRET